MSHITNLTSNVDWCRAELAKIKTELETASLRQERKDVTNISDLEIRLGELQNKISLFIPSPQQANSSSKTSGIEAEIATLKQEVKECCALIKKKYEQIFRPNQTRATDKETPQNTGLLRTALDSVWGVISGNFVTNAAPTEQPSIIEEEEFSMVERKDAPPTEFMKHQLSLSEFIF
ncbi:MAG: hypothetical protein LVR00_08625 [Rhabdochlamydiaceae bacterium]|jgi:chromosome segregation ATPase